MAKDWFSQFSREELEKMGMLPEQRLERHKRCLKLLETSFKDKRHNELRGALRKAVRNG